MTGTKTFSIKTKKLKKQQGFLQNLNTHWEKCYVLTYISKVATYTEFQVLVGGTTYRYKHGTFFPAPKWYQLSFHLILQVQPDSIANKSIS